jgi:peptidoglycan/LPS O-acetylase OafA/YrhL
MSTNTLHSRKANNFDIIRIIFAWLVIVSHSYVLLGNKGCDPLCECTNHYINLSYFGVKGFITISGFLIFKSLERSPNVLDYLWKRLLRIYPGLMIVLLLSIGMAYWIYQPYQPFFKFPNEATNYILNNLTLYHNQWRIHGVFDKNANTAINGSLWTMGFEFFFYLVLLVLFPIRKFRPLIIALLIITIGILFYGNLFHIETLKHVNFKLRVDLIFELGFFFMIGALISTLDWKKIPQRNLLALIAIICSFIVILYKLNPIWLGFSWPYLVLYIGQGSSRLADWIHSTIEDPSYGIYLYAFPVQQLIIYCFQPSVMVLLWTSTIASFLLGIASWKLIEKKMLRFKNLFVFRTQ